LNSFGWVELFVGDKSFNTEQTISGIHKYKLLKITGYKGSNVGGSRFILIVDGSPSLSLDFSYNIFTYTVNVNLKPDKITISTDSSVKIVKIDGLQFIKRL
jgi:hypothetical protein